MSRASRFPDQPTVDVDRRRPEPSQTAEPFWIHLRGASTAHIAPTLTAIAPDTGAAIAVMRSVASGPR